jgi:murein DD-endopeptidase MepM/ murein hydrolase activator NlpD
MGLISKTSKGVRLAFVGVSQAKRRRALVLVIANFFLIPGAVMLMNLETPRALNEFKAEALPAVPVASPPPAVRGAVTTTDIDYLKTKDLLLPVEGVGAGRLRDSFNDGRSEGRTHKAIDIMAPQDTPVVAVADGKVMKLHKSARGGIMLYQSDTAGPYVYYYAHLSRYADGITEGKQIKRGDVVAYVGDTGNAGTGNYHLHFGISKMPAPGKWSGGEPINPYPLLAGE